jgi:hypothetical protein
MTNGMNAPAWTFEYSIDCNTSRQFAYRYWTDIANWNEPPARFELDGPFDVGSQLTTTLPGQTYHSIIRRVDPDRAATIEMQLTEGVLSFRWEFQDLTESRTRITQRLILSTTNASLVAQANLLEQTTPVGMNKLVAAIERAFNERRDSGMA